MWVFVLFLAWPLIEIALFVTLGGALGLWLTLLIVLGSGMLGIALLRGHGLRTAERLRREMGALRDPMSPVADGALVMLAALLLILPGFLTDALGLLLLIPPVRTGLIALLASRIRVVQTRQTGPARRSDGIIIDGDFVELDTDPDSLPPSRSGPPSGWTRH